MKSVKNNVAKKISVQGKTVLLTGATGFFGRYITEGFLAAGAKVILLGRSERLRPQVLDLQKRFGKNQVYGYRVDFYNRAKLTNLLKRVIKSFKIDVLINNAFDFSPKTGFNTINGRLENTSFDQWQAAFESGIYWSVLATQIIGAQMRKRRLGSIINISSMYGLIAPNPELYRGTTKFNPPTYGVMKAGVLALTRYTATFWAEHGIRCNSISPGAFSNLETATTNSVQANDPFLERLKEKTLLGRTGHPRDLLGALLFLASDASSYMTGQNIVIDGGWTVI
ncbi:MAG: SDR family oxidoreductase [bacterium]|nr:SDR family oxidoreductase [bacterium]